MTIGHRIAAATRKRPESIVPIVAPLSYPSCVSTPIHEKAIVDASVSPRPTASGRLVKWGARASAPSEGTAAPSSGASAELPVSLPTTGPASEQAVLVGEAAGGGSEETPALR